MYCDKWGQRPSRRGVRESSQSGSEGHSADESTTAGGSSKQSFSRSDRNRGRGSRYLSSSQTPGDSPDSGKLLDDRRHRGGSSHRRHRSRSESRFSRRSNSSRAMYRRRPPARLPRRRNSSPVTSDDDRSSPRSSSESLPRPYAEHRYRSRSPARVVRYEAREWNRSRDFDSGRAGGRQLNSWRGRQAGGDVGFRGRGRHQGGPRGCFAWRGRGRTPMPSPVVDSEEEHRRSRSREKARRRRQYETIQRYCRPGGEQQVFWDGFQWVYKGGGNEGLFDQTMNATRRARRLHIGNLPLQCDASEEELKQFLWDSIRRRAGGNMPTCPVLHIWFSKERGSNYGFVEMTSVENAHLALSLNPLLWKGQQLRINRPTDWKKDAAEVNFAEIAGAEHVALLESVAAAASLAENTGNSTGLAKLMSSLPADQRKVVADFLAANPRGLVRKVHLPVELLQCQIQQELLHGAPSRVVRITCPVPTALSDEELDETLEDVLGEVNKRKDVLAALVIKKDLEQQLPAAEVGDIYVQFATCAQADTCILSFSGRMYDGRPLQIERFNDMVWNQSMKQYSKSLLAEILAQFM